ncbi:MAG TPA: DUF6542 domain-containing protein, partial [Streptosporangiaceae bacterium]
MRSVTRFSGWLLEASLLALARGAGLAARAGRATPAVAGRSVKSARGWASALAEVVAARFRQADLGARIRKAAIGPRARRAFLAFASASTLLVVRVWLLVLVPLAVRAHLAIRARRVPRARDVSRARAAVGRPGDRISRRLPFTPGGPRRPGGRPPSDRRSPSDGSLSSGRTLSSDGLVSSDEPFSLESPFLSESPLSSERSLPLDGRLSSNRPAPPERPLSSRQPAFQRAGQGPGLRLTGRGGVVVVFGTCFAGLLIADLAHWAELADAVFFMASSLTAYYVRRGSLLPIAVSPPLLFFVAMALEKLAIASGMHAAVEGTLVMLADAAPWLFAGTAL